ncbi:DUF6415 family natural product biosynthesis protein [Streptomyces sp. NPDC001922]|uniref:DUF6415 family natural product biosynthesis protein n=1 Tax=Streptomyces sp. NPDC001922 TaxID=3364624 RepID=UPI0036BB504E
MHTKFSGSSGNVDDGSAQVGAAAVDIITIQATIDRALRTSTGRIDTGELVDLEALLRGHIASLLPAAEAVTDRLWRGSLAWYTRRARLDGIRR